MKNPSEAKAWLFSHPDSADTDPVNTRYIVELPGREPVTLRPELGFYETADQEVAAALRARGFRCVNDVPDQEIDPRWAREMARLKEQS